MKKGQADLLVMVFRIIFLAALVFLLSLQLGLFTKAEIPTANMEAQLIMERILYGPGGIALRGEKTGRVLPGTVDISKLDEASLMDAYQEGFDKENLWGGRVTLYDSRESMASSKPLRDALLNKGLATNLLPLAKAGVRGSGGGLYYGATYPVQYRLQPGAELQAGWLTIELVKRT
jgi:hypothetical protein